MLVRSQREPLLDPEDKDLQGFPNEEISKSKILDTVHATRSSENVNENNIEERLQSDACELGLTDMDTANSATK
jgi:hypothetical protein